MRHASLPLLLLLALVAGAADVRAQAAPQVGTCTLGTAEAALDVNNVFGAVFNTGSLFFGNTLTNGDGYLVPKATGKSPIFASGIWIGGQVGGQLRVAGARYTNFNFWPGPLDAATGRPVNPASCRAYDRIYSVKRDDIRAFEAGGQFSQDLTDWPFQLGAPVVDGDGNPNNYNLAGGDRPEIIGDQGIWWVMNDVGNAHAGSATPPLGVEVQVLAFAFGRADALGSTTFYKYKIFNKSGANIENTYVSIFSDPDLGYASDDYVGSDIAEGLGYVYNADNLDENNGYGANPPAVGYDFFQGPIVPDGPDAGSDPDTLGTSAFSYFINGGPGATVDPTLGSAMYNFQQGLWGDATEMRDIGNGYQQTSGNVTKFAFPGDPVTGQRWSEVNNGSATPLNAPGDRRLVVHTGPFTLNNGDEQDIVFGIVYARGTSNLASITALRAADRLAQRAYDIGFALPSPPPAPALCTEATLGTGTCLSASSQSGQITLTYGYPSTSENYLGRYEVENGFIVGQGFPDETYNFEGFNIYSYPNANFASEERRLVATYDVVNGVTEVRDLVFDPAIGDNNIAITARGTDSGLQYSFTVDGLTNFTDYYYGVTAYAYNEFSSPKIIESQVTNITARPSGLTSGVRTQSVQGDSVSTVANVQNGGGVVGARVVDPTAITGASYNVVFFSAPDGSVNYNIVNTTTGVTILDGAAYYAATGHSLPQSDNVLVADGLSFSVTGPAPEVLGIDERNAAGVVIDGNLLASLNSATTRPPTYLVGAQGAASDDPAAIITRLDFNGYLLANVPNEYEIRWVDAATSGQVILNRGWDRTTPGRAFLNCVETGTVVANGAPGSLVTTPAPVVGGYPRMPFQVWEIAADGTETQMHANVIDDDADLCYSFTTAANSGAAPLTGGGYERIYVSRVPYIESQLSNPVDVHTRSNVLGPATQALGRLTILLRSGPARPPQAGTRIRVRTSKPNAVGDSFTISTAGLERSTPTLADEQAALDLIAAVPNPYYGQSGYETGNLSRVIRFTNLPSQSTTIRIYTVSGSLVQTLRKDGGSRSLDWNLTTVNNLPVASGMYLVHVDVEGVGERTLKLGVINRRSQVNVF